LQNFVGAKCYCPHALADDNQCIQSREKMLNGILNSVIYTVSVPIDKTNMKKKYSANQLSYISVADTAANIL